MCWYNRMNSKIWGVEDWKDYSWRWNGSDEQVKTEYTIYIKYWLIDWVCTQSSWLLLWSGTKIIHKIFIIHTYCSLKDFFIFYCILSSTLFYLLKNCFFPCLDQICKHFNLYYFCFHYSKKDIKDTFSLMTLKYLSTFLMDISIPKCTDFFIPKLIHDEMK